MKLKVSVQNFDKALQSLKDEYKIFAPVEFEKKGTYSDTSVIRYAETYKFSNMCLDKKSHFSAKETFLPINEVLFYFTQDEYKEPKIDTKNILVFLRACDLNAVKRIDEIYLNNGNPDYYYKKRREKVKFALIGCETTFRNCFCVSMDSNIATNYDIAMNIRKDFLYLDIKNNDLNVFDGNETEFDIDYVRKNNFDVNVPEKVDFNYLVNHSMWDEYDTRCIGCGRCNYSCPTCTCFNMQDIYYRENEDVGERRRVYASCQVDGYTDIAGGHSFRQKQGQRMRFKTLHKIHDFKERNGYNMCVGCGRCDDMCPQYISFSTAIEKVSNVMSEKN